MRNMLAQLDPEGNPEPMFCSVCGEWQEILVYFLSGRVEVSMCAECITFAGQIAVDLLDRQKISRA